MKTFKQKLKKIAKAGVGALLVGATLAVPIMATDLSDLPAPFVENGSLNFVAVIGTGGDSRTGLAEDLVSSAQVMASFAQHAVSAEVVDGISGGTSVSGELEDVPLFSALKDSFGSTLDDSDLSILTDADIQSSMGDDVGIMEKITLGNAIGITQYEGSLNIEIPSAELVYELGITDGLRDNGDAVLTCADWTTGDDTFTEIGTLDVDILGKPVTIKCLTGDTLIVSAGETSVVELGDVFEYEDWSIVLKAVDEDATKVFVEVSKDGEVDNEVIDIGAKTSALGLEIKVETAFPTVGGTTAFAEFTVGEDIEDTLTAGEEWPYNEDYEVEFDSTDEFEPIFKLVYSPEDSIEDENSIMPGESWSMLNGAFDIENKGLSSGDIVKFSFERKSDSLYDDIGDDTLGSEASIRLDIPSGVTLYDGTSSDKLYEDVWFVRAGNDVVVNSRDNEGKKTFIMRSSGAQELITGDYDETDLAISWDDTTQALTVSIGTDDVTFKTYNDGDAFIELSGTDGAADSADIVYDGTNIGTLDYEYWTAYGARIESPEDNIESGDGKVVIYVPSEEQTLNVLIGTEEVVEAQEASYNLNMAPIAIDVAKLDTEIDDKTSDNFILFGGPSVNLLVSELGYTKADFKSGEDGIGIVELVENAFGGTNDALVIAGWDAANTRLASYVAANADEYDLSGKTKVLVSGSTTSDMSVE